MCNESLTITIYYQGYRLGKESHWGNLTFIGLLGLLFSLALGR